MKNITIFISILFFVSACGATEEKEVNTIQKPVDEVKSKDNVKVIDSPCELISVAEVTSIFDIAKEFEVNQQTKEYTHPTCTFKWKDGKMFDEKNIGGNIIKLEKQNEIMIVMVKNADDKMFEQATRVYKDGINVENIGSRAIWGGQMSQLTFLAKGYMFHVNVKAFKNTEENKEKAKMVAKLLIENI